MLVEVASLFSSIGAELALELRLLVTFVTQVCEQRFLLFVGSATSLALEHSASARIHDLGTTLL